MVLGGFRCEAAVLFLWGVAEGVLEEDVGEFNVGHRG